MSNQEAVLGTAPYQLDGILGEAERIGTDKKNTTEEIQFDMHQQENRIPTVLHIIIPHRTGALPLLLASNSSRIRSIYGKEIYVLPYGNFGNNPFFRLRSSLLLEKNYFEHMLYMLLRHFYTNYA